MTGEVGSGTRDPGHPLRRTVTVLVIYVAAAWVVLALGGWLRQILVLPAVFSALLEWGVYLGAGVAALVAWFYPAIAVDSAAGTDPRRSGPPG